MLYTGIRLVDELSALKNQASQQVSQQASKQAAHQAKTLNIEKSFAEKGLHIFKT